MVLLGWTFLLIQLALALLLFFLTLAFLTGAPYVPTNKKGLETMIRLARIKKGDTVVDLGSGDGRLLFAAAKAGAGMAIGYEINPYLVLFTNILAFFSPYRKTVRAYWKNFWHADFSDADVIFIYLIPWKMKALEDKLNKNTKPNTRIISNSFLFPEFDQYAKDASSHIYAYKK